MRVADVLYCLTKQRIVELARDLDVDSWGDKNDLVSRIARSLAMRNDDSGEQLGWRGALDLLAPLLTKNDLLRVAEYLYLEGDEANYTVAPRIAQLRVDEVRSVILAACIAHESGDPVETDRLCNASDLFDRGEDEDEDLEAEIDEDELDESSVGAQEDWQSEVAYEAGPGCQLPDPLTLIDRKLFPHQERSVEALARWWSGPERTGVLCLPTGAGKTRTTIAFILRSVLSQNARVLWLAHRHELVNQAIRSFLENSAEAKRKVIIGRFEAGDLKYEEDDASVIVASIPTVSYGQSMANLERLLDINDEFDLVVIDECHHSVAKTWKRLIRGLYKEERCKKVLGLSATPTRTTESERPEFWRLFNRIVHEEKLLPLIQEGILSRPNVVPVSTDQTFRASAEQRRLFEQFGELPNSLVNEIANDDQRNRLIVKTYLDGRDRWGQTLLFAATVAQAHELSKRLNQAGIKAVPLDGTSNRDHRQMVIDAFRAGQFPVLANVTLFTEGTDLPAVQTVFIARPTRSQILFQQMVGRGLRGIKLGGTASCNVVAFYDNVLNLMSEQLSSSFSEQREAMSALGLDELEPAQPIARTAVRDEEKADKLRARAAQFAALLADSRGKTLPVSKDDFPLIGWWEARPKDGLWFLPVFSNDAASVGARVGELLRLVHEQKELPAEGWNQLEWIPEPLFKSFAQAVSRAEAPPTYVALTTAKSEAAATVAGRLAEAPLDPHLNGKDSGAWLAAAQSWQNAQLSGALILKGAAADIQLNAEDLGKLRNVWDRFRTHLPANPDASAVQVFVSLLGGLPEIASIPGHIKSELLQTAAREGNFPAPLSSPARKPSLPELRHELRSVPLDQRAAALESLHRAFFRDQFADPSTLLFELACQ